MYQFELFAQSWYAENPKTAALVSAAISLKRIADTLEGAFGTKDEPSVRQEKLLHALDSIEMNTRPRG